MKRDKQAGSSTLPFGNIDVSSEMFIGSNEVDAKGCWVFTYQFLNLQKKGGDV